MYDTYTFESALHIATSFGRIEIIEIMISSILKTWINGMDGELILINNLKN
jgi:hypothetical protein